jgi:hypothetical protein
MKTPLLSALAGVLLAARSATALDIDFDDPRTWTTREQTTDTPPTLPFLLTYLHIQPPADPFAESIKNGASTVAYGLLKFYTGNNTGDVPGNLPDPYYCALLTLGTPWIFIGTDLPTSLTD